MGSLANPFETDAPQAPKAPNNRIPLTMPGELQRVAKPRAIWSQGPIYNYKQLDAAFLQRPLIPRAPPTPRLRIDDVNGRLRVFDQVHAPEFSDMPETVSLPQLARPEQAAPEPQKPHHWPQIAAVIAGFVAGLLAALLFGWL